MQIKWQEAAALIALAFIIALLLSQKPPASNDSGIIHEKQIFRDRFDTVLSIVYVPLAPLNATAKPNLIKTITLRDTIFKETCLDTLLTSDTTAIAPDTLSICSLQNTFSISLNLSARRKEVAVPYVARDTFYSREDTVKVQTGDPRPWYQDALVIILSVVSGIVMGKL
jgi:hypothetical protein